MTDTTPEPELTGATYLLKDGIRTVVEPATADHPEGNCARDADGKALLAVDEAPVAAKVETSVVKPLRPVPAAIKPVVPVTPTEGEGK